MCPTHIPSQRPSEVLNDPTNGVAPSADSHAVWSAAENTVGTRFVCLVIWLLLAVILPQQLLQMELEHYWDTSDIIGRALAGLQHVPSQHKPIGGWRLGDYWRFFTSMERVLAASTLMMALAPYALRLVQIPVVLLRSLLLVGVLSGLAWVCFVEAMYAVHEAAESPHWLRSLPFLVAALSAVIVDHSLSSRRSLARHFRCTALLLLAACAYCLVPFSIIA